jgi:hypothetical protein
MADNPVENSRTKHIEIRHHFLRDHQQKCDTPVSPRVSLKMPNQEPLFRVNQSKHEHQINLSKKKSTKYILKSIMIKTIKSFKKIRMYNPNENPK